LPHNHELHAHLPQRPQSRQGDRLNQEEDDHLKCSSHIAIVACS
jgi:hypothetical protein